MTRARAAVFAVFGLNGFVLAMWVVHIPAISGQAGIDKPTLGLVLLVLGPAGLAGMQLSGPMSDRFGSRPVVAAAAAGVCLLAVGPGLAGNAWQLAIALAAFGCANGALDVAMNTQAVHVERAYGRPIMSAFHGVWSCGAIAGSLAGAATLHLGAKPAVALLISGALALAVLIAAVPHLVDHATRTAPRGSAPLSKRVALLGLLAFAVLLAEGAANDWSALQLTDRFGAAESVAALAFAGFSGAMTLGRFTADRIAHRFGSVAVLRYGSLLAAAGHRHRRRLRLGLAHPARLDRLRRRPVGHRAPDLHRRRQHRARRSHQHVACVRHRLHRLPRRARPDRLAHPLGITDRRPVGPAGLRAAVRSRRRARSCAAGIGEIVLNNCAFGRFSQPLIHPQARAKAQVECPGPSLGTCMLDLCQPPQTRASPKGHARSLGSSHLHNYAPSSPHRHAVTGSSHPHNCAPSSPSPHAGSTACSLGSRH